MTTVMNPNELQLGSNISLGWTSEESIAVGSVAEDHTIRGIDHYGRGDGGTDSNGYFLSYGLECLVVKDIRNQPLDLARLWNKFCESTEDGNFPVMYTSYHYFRSKGYVIKTGLKYGTDYVLYKDGPPFYHATYSVIVKSVKEMNLRDLKNRQLSWASLLALNRLNSSTSKVYHESSQIFQAAIDIAQVILDERLPVSQGLLHLVVFLNVDSSVFKAAKEVLKLFKQEYEDMLNCCLCYLRIINKSDDEKEEYIFYKPCEMLHPVVWAKISGFSHWPAKNHLDEEKFICPFHASHVLPRQERDYHLLHCAERAPLDRKMLANSLDKNNPFKGNTAVPSYTSSVPTVSDEVWDDDYFEPTSRGELNEPLTFGIVEPPALSKPAERRRLYKELHRMPTEMERISSQTSAPTPKATGIQQNRQPKAPSQGCKIDINSNVPELTTSETATTAI